MIVIGGWLGWIIGGIIVFIIGVILQRHWPETIGRTVGYILYIIGIILIIVGFVFLIIGIL